MKKCIFDFITITIYAMYRSFCLYLYDYIALFYLHCEIEIRPRRANNANGILSDNYN